jgi:Spy/CpxP family protein refolding chaperone
MHAGCWSGRHARRAFQMYGGSAGWGGCGPQAWERPAEEGWEGWAGGHGVRRPLRFLVYKLGLDERQSAELARILNELKTERAQTAVDDRRAVTAFADALAGGTFDQVKAGEGGVLRVQSAERLRGAVLKALEQIHAILNPEQRERLAYLIRTGAIIL